MKALFARNLLLLSFILMVSHNSLNVFGQDNVQPELLIQDIQTDQVGQDIKGDLMKELVKDDYDNIIKASPFTNEVVIIRPKAFYENREASVDNKFMKDSGMSVDNINALAQQEFDGFKKTLEDGGVRVHEFQSLDENAPDSIFPDWFETHRNEDIPGGVFILFPMKYRSRQLERQQHIIDALRSQYEHFVDLTHWEEKGKALEAKGAAVFDYRNQKVYVTLSSRADIEVVEDMMAEWNKLSKRPYRVVTFTSYDRLGQIIYHTDVLMTLFSDHIILCKVCLNPEDKDKVINEITSTALNQKTYEIIDISYDEVEGMCANAFNLLDNQGRNTLIMSARAKRSYSEENLKIIEGNYKVLSANIDNIEHVGGGSARCMIAQKF